jgi:hypothetical protein
MTLEQIIANNKQAAINLHRIAKRVCPVVPDFAPNETDALLVWAFDPMTMLLIDDGLAVLERRAASESLRHQQGVEAYGRNVAEKVFTAIGLPLTDGVPV